MIKKLRVLTFLLLTLHATVLVQASQQFKIRYKSYTIVPFDEHVDQVVSTFPNMEKIFIFLHEQGLIDQSFRQFLQTRLIHDELEHKAEQDANFGEVLGQAQDLITINMKKRFITILETAIKEHKTLDQFDDPVFIYVMQHKDDVMCDMVRYWLHEWSNLQDNYGQTPLCRAAQYNSAEIVRMLIDIGENLDIKNGSGKTALHMVSYFNLSHSFKITNMLIGAGANVNAQMYRSAVSDLSNSFKIMSMLIDAGANVDIQDNYGWTPLHTAAWRKCPEIIRILVGAGADLNIQNADGSTALHLIVNNNCQDIAHMLIGAGADVNIHNNSGRTAEQIAHTSEMRVLLMRARMNRNGIHNQPAACCTIS